MAQTTYSYDLETVSLSDLLPAAPRGKADGERVFACDHSGHCRVETLVDEVRLALIDRLDDRGGRGWRLAHMDIHAEVVLLVWEKPGAST